MCRGPRRYLYGHCSHLSAYMEKKTLPVTISNIDVGKGSRHCQYSLENRYQEAIRAEKHRSADKMRKHREYSSCSKVRSEKLCCLQWQTGHSFLFLPDSRSQYNDKNWIIVFTGIFTRIFPVWDIYRLEHRGVEVSNTACLAPGKRNPGVGVLESAVALGNNTSTHSFLMPPTHTCSFWRVIQRSGTEEMAFLWLESWPRNGLI